jgi:hypothetical protein
VTQKSEPTSPPADPTTSADDTTLASVLEGYERDGFSASFCVTDPDGALVCPVCGRRSDAERVELASLRRVEGESDPADMTAVVAVTCPWCRARGTVVVRYGPEAAQGEADFLRAAQDARSDAAAVPPGRPTDEPSADRSAS